MNAGVEANDEVWQQFSTVLVSLLARLPAWSDIVFEAEGNRFVQFLMADTGLACELVSNHYLGPEHRMTLSDETWLHLEGWGAPRQGRNWTRFVGWPARTSVYQDLVAHVVAAMRGVLYISAPAQLTLTAGPVVGCGEEIAELAALHVTISASGGR